MLLNSRVIVLSGEARKSACSTFEPLVKKAIDAAVANQKALGLPNYYSRNGKIYARLPNGRFASLK